MAASSRIAFLAAAGILALSVSTARADAGDWGPATSSDPNYAAAKEAIAAHDWNKAVGFLNKCQVSADVHNYLGYAYRHLGNFDEAFHNYKRALEMDPKHPGAHEYVGEAYLLTNNLPKAEEHLAALSRICGAACEQYKDLARAIAEYKKKH
jgi:Flp pilus assembly protein TadD